MYTGKLVFAQVMEHMPMKVFRRCVQTYNGNHKVKSFSCLDQYLCMAFDQMTCRESLRETEICLRAQSKKLYHMGIRGGIARNTLSNANKVRDWRIYADFAQALIKIARPLYAEEELWARTRQYNLRTRFLHHRSVSICFPMDPVSIHQICRQTSHPARSTRQYSNVYSYLEWKDARCECAGYPDARGRGVLHHGSRGYLDFARLFNIDQAGAFFVIRAKGNIVYRRQYSHVVTTEEKSRGVRCDQTIVLAGINSKNDYPQQLRRIKYYDSKSNKTFNFLTNNFTIPAQTVADLYRYRWQVELFFKWIKPHLRIKSFFGMVLST